MTDQEDQTKGLYSKYRVERLNDPKNKHDNCFMFVLDIEHDVHARAALAGYADSCEDEYPLLAADLRDLLNEIHLQNCEICSRFSKEDYNHD